MTGTVVLLTLLLMCAPGLSTMLFARRAERRDNARRAVRVSADASDGEQGAPPTAVGPPPPFDTPAPVEPLSPADALERSLCAARLAGELGRHEYRARMERLAREEDVRRPLSVPRSGDK
ncbi:hypothetical protein K7472_14165 [Streptomyces sp. PTM05]|uniref:SHOCT domain-containing protein n=1 Tax=Streptantibioticus parmotrematis TaxID=2873249 RepID=A0ABS7QTH9_9ACTN|nr:hypothetical protein [Streptantibioticus parmotrematis]MBY8885994.1 hypothetical protein [Streptantibioticus parmotrematis]